MAITDVSAADENPVGAALERPEDMMRADGCRAHGPNGKDMRRLLHAVNTGEVRRSIGTPTAKKRDDLWFELISFHLVSPVKHCR